MRIVGGRIDIAGGDKLLHALGLIGGHRGVAADPEALERRKAIEGCDVLDLRTARDVEMVKPGQVFQRAEIRNVGGVQLQILQIGAVAESTDIRDGGHGDDAHLKLRHGGRKREISQIIVVAEVKIFHIRAVPEHRRVLDHAAHRWLGGKDALDICAHAVVFAEPDAPDDFGLREELPHRLQRLVGDAGAVHVHIAAVVHAGQHLEKCVAVIGDADAAIVQLFRIEVDRSAVQGKAVAELYIGTGRLQQGDILPRDGAGFLAAELHALQPVHALQHHRQRLHVLMPGVAQVKACGLALKRLAADHGRKMEFRRGAERADRLHILYAELLGADFAEAERAHIRQIGQRIQHGRDLRSAQPCEVQLLCVAVDPLPVGQLHRIDDRDLRMFLRPECNLLIAFAAAKIRAFEPRKVFQLAQIPFADYGLDILCRGGHTLAAELDLYAAEQGRQDPRRLMVYAGHAEHQRTADDQQGQKPLQHFLKTHLFPSGHKNTLHQKIISSVRQLCKTQRGFSLCPFLEG